MKSLASLSQSFNHIEEFFIFYFQISGAAQEKDLEPSLDLTRGISSRCSSEDVREASCDIGKGW